MQKRYLEAAHAAYQNSLELLEEARLLYNNSRYARAFSLAVLASEEFSKSFLYKCRAEEFLSATSLSRMITDHEVKVNKALHILSFAVFFSKYESRIRDATEKDRLERNHREHQYPKVVLNSFIDWIGKPGFKELIDLLKYAHKSKLNAFYVDVRKRSVAVPNKTIRKETCDKLLNVLESFIPGFNIILAEDKQQFKHTLKMLDPIILGNLN